MTDHSLPRIMNNCSPLGINGMQNTSNLINFLNYALLSSYLKISCLCISSIPRRSIRLFLRHDASIKRLYRSVTFTPGHRAMCSSHVLSIPPF